jgi:hypothetical protein
LSETEDTNENERAEEGREDVKEIRICRRKKRKLRWKIKNKI